MLFRKVSYGSNVNWKSRLAEFRPDFQFAKNGPNRRDLPPYQIRTGSGAGDARGIVALARIWFVKYQVHSNSFKAGNHWFPARFFVQPHLHSGSHLK